MVELSFQMLGKEVFVRGFNRYAHKVQDWREAFEQVWQNYIDINRRNFQRGGYPQRFKSLSPAYRAWKDKHYPGRPILTLTGDLRRSMTGAGQATAQHTIKDIRKLRAEFGTTVPYARAHQDGYPPRNLPRRPPLQLTNYDLTFWTRIIHEWAWKEGGRA